MGERFGVDESFQTAVRAFHDNTAYWVLGHAFDTLLDCLSICRPANTQDDPQWKQLAHMALDKLHVFDGGQPPECHIDPKPPYYAQGESWYDDSGWWAIAALKAYLLADDLGWGEYKNHFLALCLAKWTRFDENAPRVYERCGTDGDKLDPLFPGGVWNSTWPHSPPDQNCTDPCDPKTSLLGGFQNTVTNTLYLVAAERLSLAGKTDTRLPNAAAAAEREFAFLSRWFTPGIDDVDPFLHRFAGEEGPVVVRERVTAYKSLDIHKKPIKPHGYVSKQAWTGDQGILIGGLIERAERHPGEAGELTKLATDLIDGVLLYCNDANGMLLNWPLKLEAPGKLPDAYATRFGAFIRYLTRALDNAVVRAHVRGQQLLWRPNNDLNAEPVKKTYSDLFRDMVGRTGRGATPFGEQYGPASDLTVSINDLAIRVLAYKLSL